jgi:hypothetical protein
MSSGAEPEGPVAVANIDMNRQPPEIAARSVFASVPLGWSATAYAGASGNFDPGQVGLSSSSHSTALIGNVTDSVVVNASIRPWISRSYNVPVSCDDAADVERYPCSSSRSLAIRTRDARA